MMPMLENDATGSVALSSGVNSHDIGHRKKLGAFYTPLTVSTALSNWGIRTPKDRVLEPCFGGCTFLEAAVSRLTALGSKLPESNLFGCDIDPLAFSHLNSRVKPANVDGHFFQQDFLEFVPQQCVDGKMDLVIGNPPYIRHANFSAKQRETVAQISNDDVNLHGRANLWAYFVVHALRFIKNGGRLALVLPGSFLYADYSASIRKFVCSKFERVVAFTLAERLFLTEGTEETTVVLLAEGFGKAANNSALVVRCVESTDELTSLVKGWPADIADGETAHPGHGLVPAQIGRLHDSLSTVPGMRIFEDIAIVRIGLVTGDTPYFVKSKAEWKTLKIGNSHLRHIMPRSQYVPGITIDAEKCSEHVKSDVRCLALSTPQKPQQADLVKYLNSYPELKRANNSTFRRRPIWHQFTDVHGIPDAFFVFMADLGPRLILNNAKTNSTNSMYRVFFVEGVSISQQKLIALSMYTTFSQLAAEIIGHPRGSGALKLEPSRVLKLALYLPTDRNIGEINSAFKRVDELLRQGDAESARYYADEFLFNSDELMAVLPALRTGLEIVRSRRIR